MTNERAIQIMNDNFLGYTLEEIHDAKRHITLALCPDYYKQFESHGVISVGLSTTDDISYHCNREVYT